MTYRTASPATSDRDLRQIVAGIMDGKINATGTVTLTASDTTTTLTDPRIGAGSVILFMPTTANAKTAAANLYVSARASGSATLTHASSANVDQTFGYVVIG
jgi:phage tail sheath gpL-like